MCLWGAPSPVYKGVEEGEDRPSLWRAIGSPTPIGSRIPPFHVVGVGEGRRKEGEGKGGVAPFLVQIGPEEEGARGLPWQTLLSFLPPLSS